MPIEAFNISFESTQNKQHYGTKITCREIRLKKRGGGGERRKLGKLKFDLKWGV